MHIILLCATARGRLVLEKLSELAPGHELTVFSFPERPWEPPFLEAIRETSLRRGARFFEKASLSVGLPEPPVDLILAVSWRYLIPSEIFRSARLGAYVMHDSLLPAYRGFMPTVWAVLNGETKTGVTLFEMAEKVDSGPIIDQRPVLIGPEETIAEVMERVTDAYLTLLERNLGALLAGSAPRRPQDESLASYTCRRDPEDNLIDWNWPAGRIFNLIRAVTKPYTGAFTFLNGVKLTIWAARPLPDYPRYIGVIPGKIVEVREGEGSVVLTGDGALLLTCVNREGGPVVRASELLNSLACVLRSC